MHWLWLTLLCAAALASADAATKAWLRDFSALRLLLVRFTLAGLMLAPFLGQLPTPQELPPALWGWLIVLVPFEMAAMLLYLIAIRDHPLSLTLPYLAFTPAFVLIIAYFLLGETSNWLGVLGVFAIVAGAWMLNATAADSRRWQTWLRPLQAILWDTGSRLMLAVAMIYALTATLGKAALATLPPTQFGALYYAVLGLSALALYAITAYWAQRPPTPAAVSALLLGALINPPAASTRQSFNTMPTRRQRWKIGGAVMLVAALNATMILTHFLAMELANVGYMIAVKRTSLLFGMLYGFLCFHEPMLRQRLPAAGLMLVGVFLIAAAS